MEIKETLNRIKEDVEWNRKHLDKLTSFTLVAGLAMGIPIGMAIEALIRVLF